LRGNTSVNTNLPSPFLLQVSYMRIIISMRQWLYQIQRINAFIFLSKKCWEGRCVYNSNGFFLWGSTLSKMNIQEIIFIWWSSLFLIIKIYIMLTLFLWINISLIYLFIKSSRWNCLVASKQGNVLICETYLGSNLGSCVS
jgi:hypothetical protein